MATRASVNGYNFVTLADGSIAVALECSYVKNGQWYYG